MARVKGFQLRPALRDFDGQVASRDRPHKMPSASRGMLRKSSLPVANPAGMVEVSVRWRVTGGK